MTNTLSPPTKPSRVSVPISAHALETFERLAKASNASTGRAIADWLDDTLEGAEFMAVTMEKARAAPRVAIAEMHAYALGLADETGAVMARIRAKGSAEAPGRASGTRDADGSIPPSCNTGGKVPRDNPNTKGGKSK